MRRRPDPGRGAAFTLVELVVVLAIIGIAIAATVPALRPAEDDRGDAAAAARALESAYARARDLAATRALPVTVVYEPPSRRYAVLVWRHGALPVDTVEVGRVPERVRVRIEGAGARIAAATFGPLGGARARPITFTDGERRYVVSVDPWTGKIQTHGRRLR